LSYPPTNLDQLIFSPNAVAIFSYEHRYYADYDPRIKFQELAAAKDLVVEVIEAAAARATRTLQEADGNGLHAYTILLILTDGAVSDVQATATSLNQASDAPLVNSF
jgi:hypothetical protein